jgi:hypothetical protein
MSSLLMAEVVLFESDRIPAEQLTHPPNVGEAFFAGLRCPTCGYWVSVDVDLSAGEQTLIEDCPSCCHPIEITLHSHDLEFDGLEVEKVH